MTNPTIEIAAYTVSSITNPDLDMSWGGLFAIHVERTRTGLDLWAVRRAGRCLNTTGTWDHERQPSNRIDAWLTAHRFPLVDALQAAQQAAPGIIVNGVTVQQAIDSWPAHD